MKSFKLREGRCTLHVWTWKNHMIGWTGELYGKWCVYIFGGGGGREAVEGNVEFV